MRVLFFSMLCCIFLSSCQGNDQKQEGNQGNSNQKEMSEKYQMKVMQTSDEGFTVVCLDKFSGDVFVRNNNGSWYNAMDKTLGLKKYQTPVYSLDVVKGSGENFQVVLFNTKNGNVYVRSSTSAWYEASGIKALENN